MLSREFSSGEIEMAHERDGGSAYHPFVSRRPAVFTDCQCKLQEGREGLQGTQILAFHECLGQFL